MISQMHRVTCIQSAIHWQPPQTSPKANQPTSVDHAKCKPSNHQWIYPWRHWLSRLQAWPKSTFEMSSFVGSLHWRTARGDGQNSQSHPVPLAMESWDHAFPEALTLNSGAKETIQSRDEFIIARCSQTTTPHTTSFFIFSMLRPVCTCNSWSELLFACWWVTLNFLITNDFQILPLRSSSWSPVIQTSVCPHQATSPEWHACG